MALSLQHFCPTTARCIQNANDDYCLEDYFEKHASSKTWFNKKRGWKLVFFQANMLHSLNVPFFFKIIPHVKEF